MFFLFPVDFKDGLIYIQIEKRDKMKNTVPSYFKKFSCIADKCPDTCCAGWEVVADQESLDKYNALQTEYGEKIRSLLTVDSDGDTIYKSCDGRCPFLLGSGLCEMYIELGHENLCRTCRMFPRHITDFGSRLETGLSFSCPEAARLITESPDPITFETVETKGNISPNSIDPTMYFTLLKARKLAIDILQNRKYSIERRLMNFLLFSAELDKHLKHGEFVETEKTTDNYSFSEEKHKIRSAASKKALKKYFSDFLSLEKLNPGWVGYSSECAASSGEKSRNFRSLTSANQWEYEHFAVYLVFRYFMTAVFDYDLLTKAKFTVLSFILICRIQAFADASEKENRVEIMQKYSKEVEHSADNLEAMSRFIRKSKYYSVENLINILSEQEENL